MCVLLPPMQHALDFTVADFKACLTLVVEDRERKRTVIGDLRPQAAAEARRLARRKANLDRNLFQEGIVDAEKDDRRLAKLEHRLRAAIAALED